MKTKTGRETQAIIWTVSALLAAASQLGLAATPNPQMATPNLSKPQLTLVHPPGNLIVRLNGMGAITGKVFPAIIAATQPLNRTVSQKTLYNGTAELLIGPPQAYVTVGINVKSELTGLTLTVPVDADDWKASFVAADPQRARVQSTFDFNRASLRVGLKISTQPIGTLPANIPDPLNLLRFTRISDTFSIELNGFKGNLDVRLKKSGNGIAIDAIEGFDLTLTDVDVGDSGPLEEIASAVLGLNRLFRIEGGKVNSADTAAKRLLNDLLRGDLGIEAEIKKYANQALTSFDSQQFLNQEFNVASGVVVFVSPNFVRLQSGSNWLINEWAPGIDAKPDDRIPELRPRGAATVDAMQPISAEPASGHAQVFAPYTLIEHVLYELIQAGLLRDIVVPSAANGGVGNGFKMHLVPTQSPQLQRDPDNPDQLALACTVRMDDTTVGSTTFTPPSGPVPAGPAPRVPVDVTTVGATAAMTVFLRPRSAPSSGVYVEVTAVSLDNLAGALRVAMVSTDLAPFRGALQNAITAALRTRAPQIGLLPRSINVAPPLKIVLGAPKLGPVYVSFPITVAN